MGADLIHQKRRKVEEAEVGSRKDEITYCSFSSDLKRSLSDFLDADHGLLEKLSGVLTDRQYRSLCQYRDYDRNDKLMDIVNLLPRDDFLKSLLETGQHHIVNFVKFRESNRAVDVSETCWPMTEDQRNILRSNRYVLADLMNINQLLPMLFSSNCITHIHCEKISVEKTAYDRNLYLLAILLKRSQADFTRVANALVEIGQEHLASIFSEGGGVVAVRSVFAEPHLEVGIANKLMQWREEASQEDLKRMNQLLGPNMRLVDVRESSSVAVYIHGGKLSAIQRLVEMLKDGTLKSALGEIFSLILDGRHEEILELEFFESSYNSCLHFFYGSMGLYDEFTVCDLHNVTYVMEQRKCNPAIKDLMLELLEIVLVKGVLLVFKHLLKLSADADSLAITTVFKVCQNWRYVLNHRPFIKQQIRRTLDRVSRPFRRRIGSCRGSVFVSKTDGKESRVRGVGTLDSQLFIVSEDPTTLCVFELTSPFTRLRDIELRTLFKDPPDIATCEGTGRIYLANCGFNCVWRIDWSSSSSSQSPAADNSSPAVKFIDCEGYEPWTLSTSGRRQQLLVTSVGGNSLYVYYADGTLLQRVTLSTGVDDDGVVWFITHHAVQATTGDNYFVCRFGRDRQQLWVNTNQLLQVAWRPTNAEVAEYNPAGQRLRSFYSGPQGDGPHQVNLPMRVAMIGEGRLVIADSGSRRVLMLNAELKLERVLLSRQQLNVDDSDDSKPEKLCYNSEAGLLCVGMDDGRVNVYEIR